VFVPDFHHARLTGENYDIQYFFKSAENHMEREKDGGLIVVRRIAGRSTLFLDRSPEP
jgi:hypothetical protein